MALVRQVRVIRNVVVTAICCTFVLYWVRSHLIPQVDALLLGVVTGSGYGLLRWRQLSRKVTRRDRRFERNKIIVHYLNVAEIAFTAVAFNHYLAIPLIVAALIAVLLGVFSDHWWTVLAGSFGLSGSAVLAVCILREERERGPLYYQYDSRSWQGAEGMLFYQIGEVVRPLAPRGTIRVIKGELWSAVSAAGERIDTGEHVEVLSLDGLTLYVDRIPSSPQNPDSGVLIPRSEEVTPP
jgi:membrane protein implicated in regulation of membrane protease activity